MVVSFSKAVMEIVVKRPVAFGRWRWLVCFWLIKLAAYIYPFKLQFYRDNEWYDGKELQ